MRTTSTYTPINVTLTEGEIGIILCSLEDYVKNLEEDSKEVREIDQIFEELENAVDDHYNEKDGYYGGSCLLYTSPSPRDRTRSRMPSSA